MKIPNLKNQNPNESQTPNLKSPNITASSSTSPPFTLVWSLRFPDLRFVWFLVLEIWNFPVSSLDVEFLDLAIQRSLADREQIGRLFPLAVRQFEGTLDVVLLDFRERSANE